MNWGLYNIELGKTQANNPYADMGTIKALPKENMWGKYFASLNSNRQNPQANPFDAMTKLNAYYRNQKAEDTTLVNDIQESSSAQNTKSPKPEDIKLEKAKTKLSKLSKSLMKSDFPKITQKLDNSLKLLIVNPELSYLTASFADKFSAASEKLASLTDKSMSSLENTDLTVSQVNEMIESIKNEYKQLQNDWKKVVIGYTKAGAYSEAMMLVNNEKNKNKYKKGAIKAVADLPEFKADAKATQNTQKVQDSDNNQETDNTPSEETGLDSDIQAQTTEIEIENTNISANPFDMNTDTQEEIQDESKPDSDDISDDNSDDISLDKTSDEELEAEDDEFKKLKSEIKEDLKKENVKNPEDKRVIVDTENGPKVLKSVLFG